MTKLPQEKINGILLLDKPLHMTSNAALQRIKRLFAAKKAGHTGSLDPLATGMLPICFGEATKFCQYLLESDKYYRVKAKLGIRTATGDAEGKVLATKPVAAFSPEQFELVLQSFRGPILQIPPMYSAVKHQGQPLYKLARRGIEIERQARTVTIHKLKLIEFTADTLTMDVYCTKGTYIRTLIDEIGLQLGCGAYVMELHRTAVSPYQSGPMYTLSELESIHEDQGLGALRNLLLPLESSVTAFPALQLTTSAAFYLRTGQPVMAAKMPAQGLIRLYSEQGQFIGIGEMMDDGRVSPRRLIDTSGKVA